MNEISNETLKKLIKIVEKRIKTINAYIATNQQQIQRVNEYDELVNQINRDNQCFADSSFTVKLEELLGGIEINDKEKLELLFEKVNYLQVISNSIIDGYYKEFTEDELKIIKEVIDLILYFKSVSHEQKSEQRSNVTKSNEELVRCVSLYDKLRNGSEGLEHFDEDLSYVLWLVNQEEMSFRKNVLVLIQELSKHIHENVLRQIEEDELVAISTEYDEEEKNEEIDEDLIRGVFAKYGFNYDFFTEKHKLILSRIALKRIESVLEVLSSYDEYQFVRNYQKRGDEKNLFLVIRYATKETLEYLIIDAQKRGVRVAEIFGVSGVYKKVSKNGEREGGGGDGPTDDEHLTGTYEYYKKNADLFEKLSLQYNLDNPGSNVDFFKDALLKTPEVLALPSHLLAENIELAQHYKIKTVKKTVMGETRLYCASMYQSRHFAELCDVLIEHGLYDYFTKYPSVLKEEKVVKKILYANEKGTLERLPNGMISDIRNSPDPYDLDVVINRDNLDKYIAKVPTSIIEFVENPDNKKLLGKLTDDQVMTAMDNNPEVKLVNDFTYSINGVLVSRSKFRRIWYLMTMSGHMNEGDLNNLLMYALIYRSYYNDEELKVLEEFANGFNFGGITLWNI